MTDRSFEPLQRVIGILLTIFLVFLLTATLAGAFSSVSQGQDTGTTSNTTAQQSIKPNQYVLHGVDHDNKSVSIVYSTASITGGPSLDYNGSEGTYNFTGDEIHIQETEMGTMVSLPTIEYEPDADDKTLTLLVPAINLHGKAQDFQTIAIKIYNWTNIGGTDVIEGQIQSYEVINLNGTANNVMF